MSRIALRNIVVHQLYGRDFDRLGIDELSDAVNVVYGSNGSGKTTLAEASSRLFNAIRKNVQRSDRIRAEINVDAETIKVEIDGPQENPAWPQSPRVGLYRLNIADIITGPADEDHARIRDALVGGINLAKLEVKKAGRLPRELLNQSAQKLLHARRQAEDLQRSEAQLQQRREELGKATTAQSDLRVIDAWLEAAEIDAQGEQLAEAIKTLEQQYPGVERQNETVANQTETQLGELQAALREMFKRRVAIFECGHKRARRVLQHADGEAIRRLKDEANRLKGQIDSSFDRSRACENLIADVHRELQRARPDNLRPNGNLDEAVLEETVEPVVNAQQQLDTAEGDLNRAQQVLMDASHDFQLAGGNPQQHRAHPCPADQIQAVAELDSAIDACRSSIIGIDEKIAAAKLEVQHRRSDFQRVSVPPRQILEELLREPSITSIEDQFRACRVTKEAYNAAAEALAPADQQSRADQSVEQAIEALRDWLKSIPEPSGRDVPAAIVIACFALAAISLAVALLATAVIAGMVTAAALAGTGLSLLLFRRRNRIEDRRRFAGSRVPQQWLPVDWSVDSVAARYAEVANAKAKQAVIESVAHDLRNRAQHIELARAQKQLQDKIRNLAPYIQVQNVSCYLLGYLVPRLAELQTALSRHDDLIAQRPQLEQKLEQFRLQRRTLLSQLECPVQSGAAANLWASKLEALIRAETQQATRLRARDKAADQFDRAHKNLSNFFRAYDWHTEGAPRILGNQLKQWFDISSRLDEAEADAQRAAHRLTELRSERERIDSQITTLFENYGYTSDACAVDAIESFLEWFERCEQWAQSVRRANQLRRNLRSLLDDAGAPEARRTLRHRVTLLRQREDSARQHRELSRSRHDKLIAGGAKRAGHDSLEVFQRRELPERPDQQQLVAEREKLLPLAQERDVITQEISATEALIRERGHQRVVADAEHVRASAIEELQEWMDVRVDEVAMQTVLDRIRELFGKEEQPKLISTANHWLSRLSGDRYGDLELTDDEIHVTDGVDESRRKSIRELSTGTQVHLALAVRLAVIEASEKHDRFPLFLDEVMATSDATASEAVAEAVKRIASDRQVVIFTNQADDISILRKVLGDDLPVKCLAATAPPAYAPPIRPPVLPPRQLNPNTLPIASPTALWPPTQVAAILPELNQSAATVRDAIELLESRSRINVEAKLHAVESIRREVAKAHRRVQWSDIEGEKWTDGKLRDRIQRAWEKSEGQPLQFLESLSQIDHIRQDRISSCEQWLSDNGYLALAPTLDQLAQTALAALPNDYPDRLLIAQGLALGFAQYAVV